MEGNSGCLNSALFAVQSLARGNVGPTSSNSSAPGGSVPVFSSPYLYTGTSPSNTIIRNRPYLAAYGAYYDQNMTAPMFSISGPNQTGLPHHHGPPPVASAASLASPAASPPGAGTSVILPSAGAAAMVTYGTSSSADGYATGQMPGMPSSQSYSTSSMTGAGTSATAPQPGGGGGVAGQPPAPSTTSPSHRLPSLNTILAGQGLQPVVRQTAIPMSGQFQPSSQSYHATAGSTPSGTPRHGYHGISPAHGAPGASVVAAAAAAPHRHMSSALPWPAPALAGHDQHSEQDFDEEDDNDTMISTPSRASQTSSHFTARISRQKSAGVKRARSPGNQSRMVLSTPSTKFTLPVLEWKPLILEHKLLSVFMVVCALLVLLLSPPPPPHARTAPCHSYLPSPLPE